MIAIDIFFGYKWTIFFFFFQVVISHMASIVKNTRQKPSFLSANEKKSKLVKKYRPLPHSLRKEISRRKRRVMEKNNERPNHKPKVGQWYQGFFIKECEKNEFQSLLYFQNCKNQRTMGNDSYMVAIEIKLDLRECHCCKRYQLL